MLMIVVWENLLKFKQILKVYMKILKEIKKIFI